MTDTAVAPRFGSAVEAQQAGPWKVVQQMPDGRWINAGQMTRNDVLELADYYKPGGGASRVERRAAR
jgi:hypothetical protein